MTKKPRASPPKARVAVRVVAERIAVKRGEIYRTREKVSERGHKPGFDVIVSRDFVAGNEDVSCRVQTIVPLEETR